MVKQLILHPRDASAPSLCSAEILPIGVLVWMGLPRQSGTGLFGPANTEDNPVWSIICPTNIWFEARDNAENCCVMPFSCQNTAVNARENAPTPETSCNASFKFECRHHPPMPAIWWQKTKSLVALRLSLFKKIQISWFVLKTNGQGFSCLSFFPTKVKKNLLEREVTSQQIWGRPSERWLQKTINHRAQMNYLHSTSVQ